MRDRLLALFMTIGMALSLGEAIVCSVDNWVPLLIAAVLLLVTFAFVGCIDLRPGRNDAVGWAAILTFSLLSCYIGFQTFGISSVGGVVHLILCLVYALSGVIGVTAALKRAPA